MKTKLAIAMVLVLAPMWAHAGSGIEAVKSGIIESLDIFENESTGAVIRRFNGVNALVLAGHGSTAVKVLLKNPQEVVNYRCEEDHETGAITCSEGSASGGHGGHDHEH